MKEGFGIDTLKDSNGNPTAQIVMQKVYRHLVGLFNRTIQFLSHGIKPIWVFDGKPPEKKKDELKRRHELKTKAEEQKGQAEEEGKLAEAKMMAGRSIRVTPDMTEDAKKLVRLMGLPMIEAASEAEAQCSVLARAGKAYATATEDMDALTFGTPRLLRGFSSKKEPIIEIELAGVLEEFEMSMDEFIDLCIMCGCDYTPHIEGIGPVKAYKFIKAHKTIEAVLAKIEGEVSKTKKEKKYKIPAGFDYVTARKLFKEPDVLDPEKIEVTIFLKNICDRQNGESQMKQSLRNSLLWRKTSVKQEWMLD
eukprot:TRINITY_DN1752_c0_g1_i1.p3 TRINITY_DN1752_c0_g1~~TRINITY_DN1752_c0_g1_i1.p3  ORF type:complete len:307 (-),score=44.58 TRINITY_DN1752_c0_g1_i1:6301-7221(-)